MTTPLPTILVAAVLLWVVPAAAAHLAVSRERRLSRGVRNYRGVRVPLGLGWAWLAWAAVAAAVALVTRADATASLAPLLVAGAAGLGWLDDRYGAGGPKGFRGHLSALAHGRLTTGLAKLVGVGVLALMYAWPLRLAGAGRVTGYAHWLLAASVIALTTNVVNLLDLRPGRALKAYVLVATAVVLAFAVRVLPPPPAWLGGLAVAGTALSFLGPAIACLPMDLKERAMLGDMGANAAGALAGSLLASALPLPGLVVALVVLLALNLASERVSFSAVIEGNGVLRWIDGLGRRGGVTAGRDGETGQ